MIYLTHDSILKSNWYHVKICLCFLLSLEITYAVIPPYPWGHILRTQVKLGVIPITYCNENYVNAISLSKILLYCTHTSCDDVR